MTRTVVSTERVSGIPGRPVTHRLTLECGHAVRRSSFNPRPPDTVRCITCEDAEKVRAVEVRP